MDEMGSERLRLAGMLMETLEDIERESGIFLIKPMFSYSGKYVMILYIYQIQQQLPLIFCTESTLVKLAKWMTVIKRCFCPQNNIKDMLIDIIDGRFTELELNQFSFLYYKTCAW